MDKFAELGLRAPILRAVEEGGYEVMTPIQCKAIPILLSGKDLIGVAQTGTGKTAAFSLPIIHMLAKGEGQRKPKTARSLILAPTRELAIQIEENIRAYAKYLHYRISLVYGGASQKPQVKAMAQGVDILIATPGRLLDLVNQNLINLREVEFFVLDEADRMLDMGFIRDIRKIVAELPKDRQTIMFSATMPKSVEGLAQSILRNPGRIDIAPASTTAERVDQFVLMVPKNEKRKLLAHVLKDQDIKRVLIFTRTKHGANRVSKNLDLLGVSSSAIHGNKSQGARQKALNEFKNGDIRALVATDVAARGIDVDDVTHVINFDLPNEPESYVHRIGRTARAGAAGISLSFCDHEERGYLRDIEKITRQKIRVMTEHPFHEQGMEPLAEGTGEDGAVKRAGNPNSSRPDPAAKRRNNSRRRGGAKPSVDKTDNPNHKSSRSSNKRTRSFRG
jgi:ATP-dependent RNA helicase RhlE